MGVMLGLEGTRLGRYWLSRRLGHGGMAEVFLGYDQEMRRAVAVKVVDSKEIDLVLRFRREVETIGSLTHEHILPVFDYGEQGEWRYLVMQYVEGGTLRERLEDGPLAPKEAGHILRQVASALQFAHACGIIHRDIKPSNILLRGDYAYLADFGLARPVDRTTRLTQTGTLIGTPEYMAPELAHEEATSRVDIYALGVVLYQMLTGRVPFTGNSVLAVYWKHLQESPIPPSRLNPTIPVAVDQVVLRALAKDPRQRFQTAGELAHAYHQALEVMQQSSTLSDLQAEVAAPLSRRLPLRGSFLLVLSMALIFLFATSISLAFILFNGGWLAQSSLVRGASVQFYLSPSPTSTPHTHTTPTPTPTAKTVSRRIIPPPTHQVKPTPTPTSVKPTPTPTPVKHKRKRKHG
jgi:serine/threonine protein kinase